MGAQQSTGGAGADAGAGAGAEVKTSYYELLGVERTATEDDIKKAYRRKALELHPDRNYGDTERTTALFADIQSAYQVLSDPQERSWYDAHEGDILRGGDRADDEHYEYNMRVTTADDLSRMMGKFRGNVDFTDSPNGFFGFVRETFEQLAREEEHAADREGVNIPDYPSFGHKDDTHEDVVRNFYATWNGFATVKSFAWMDVYRTSDALDRRMRRLIEKENRKFREDGIRTFNEAVRTLVAFVRKRDPRYTPTTQDPEEAAKAQRKARNAQAARARAAQAAKVQEDAVPDWAKARDSDELLEESEEEVDEDVFECVACNKTFKSERQWEAHERSKKHKKAIQTLKWKMQKDNANLNLDDDVASGAATPVADDVSEEAFELESPPPEGSVGDLADSVSYVKIENDDTDDELDVRSYTSRSGATTPSKPQATPTPDAPTDSDSDDDSDDDDEYASRSDIEARLAGFRKPDGAPDLHNEDAPNEDAPNADAPNEDAPNDDAPPSNNLDTADAAPAGKKLGAAAKKRAKKAAKQAPAEDDESPELKHKCATCKAGFPSKTQLFQHIKDFKHAAPATATKGAGGAKKGKRK